MSLSALNTRYARGNRREKNPPWTSARDLSICPNKAPSHAHLHATPLVQGDTQTERERAYSTKSRDGSISVCIKRATCLFFSMRMSSVSSWFPRLRSKSKLASASNPTRTEHTAASRWCVMCALTMNACVDKSHILASWMYTCVCVCVCVCVCLLVCMYVQAHFRPQGQRQG